MALDSLDFDATKPSVQPDFSGKLKYESRYLYDRYLAHAQFSAKQSTYYSYSELDFVTELNQVRGHLDTALVMYITNHPTGSTYFMEQESLSNLYFMAAFLEAYASKREQTAENFTELSASYFDILNTLNIKFKDVFESKKNFGLRKGVVWKKGYLVWIPPDTGIEQVGALMLIKNMALFLKSWDILHEEYFANRRDIYCGLLRWLFVL